MPNFVDALRMNNIFSSPQDSGSLLGAPDFNGTSGGGVNVGNAMRDIFNYKEMGKQNDMRRQQEMATFGNTMNRNNKALDANFARQYGNAGMDSAPGVQGGQMRTSYGGMTDYQRAQNAVAQDRLNVEREKIGQRATTSDRTLDIRQQDSDTRAQRAKVYEFIHNLSDAEKQQIAIRARSGDIEAQAQNALILEEARQSGRESIAGMNNDAAAERNLATITGANSRNAATNQTSLATAGIRNQPQPLSPSQQTSDIFNRAQSIANDGSFPQGAVTVGPGGTYTIDPSLPPDVAEMIRGRIGGRTSDIQLPAGNAPYKPQTPYQPTYTPDTSGANTPRLPSKYQGSVKVTK